MAAARDRLDRKPPIRSSLRPLPDTAEPNRPRPPQLPSSTPSDDSDASCTARVRRRRLRVAAVARTPALCARRRERFAPPARRILTASVKPGTALGARLILTCEPCGLLPAVRLRSSPVCGGCAPRIASARRESGATAQPLALTRGHTPRSTHDCQPGSAYRTIHTCAARRCKVVPRDAACDCAKPGANVLLEVRGASAGRPRLWTAVLNPAHQP
jgi:hypothetical protein